MTSELPDAHKLAEAFIPPEAKTTGEPILVMLSGLPGTGKSHLSRILAQRLDAIIIESDRVRKATFKPPTYTLAESELVHRVCRIAVRVLLMRGANVIYDATNLNEAYRELVYHLADIAGARLVVVQTVAPEEVVRARLERRKARQGSEELSDADWRVYQEMRRGMRKDTRFGRNVITIDTTADTEEAIAKIMRVIRRTHARTL